MVQVFEFKASSHPRNLKDSGASSNCKDCREKEIPDTVQILELKFQNSRDSEDYKESKGFRDSGFSKHSKKSKILESSGSRNSRDYRF